MKARNLLAVVLCLACFSSLTGAETSHAETDLEAMQDQLNAEVMASAFNAGDIKKAEVYVEDALKKKIRPAAAPSYWQPGWNCGHLTSYRYYNYYDYRNCLYYRRYYGRYW